MNMNARRRIAWLGLVGLALGWLLTGPAAGAGAEPSAWLEVEVRGLPGDVGPVLLALFNQGQGFPDENQALRKARLTVKDGRCAWRVEGLAPGGYALAFYQDVNQAGRLETNWLGIPKVPYGFSGRGAILGPPDFAQARFDLAPGANRQVLDWR